MCIFNKQHKLGRHKKKTDKEFSLFCHVIPYCQDIWMALLKMLLLKNWRSGLGTGNEDL